MFVGIFSLRNYHFPLSTIKCLLLPIINSARAQISECAEDANPNPSDSQIEDDDLVKAFSHLDFEALLDVSQINSKFHQIIAENFISAYQLDRNQLHIKGVSAKAPASAIRKKYPNRWTVENVNLITKVLQNYGYLVRNVEIDGIEADYVCVERIVALVEKYCARSLTSLTLSHMNRLPIEKWHPFEQVQHVVIDAVELYKDTQLHSIFPNLRTLSLYPLARTKLANVLQPFPHLEHFGIYTASNQANQEFVKSFVRLNQRLSSLSVADAVTNSFAEFLRDNLPDLKALRLISLSSEFFYEEPRKIINFKKVVDFSLTIYKNSNQTITFPFAFDALKTLTLDVPGLSDRLIEAAVKNDELERVAIVKVIPTYPQLRRIVRALPKLKEIYLSYNRRAIESISKLMGDDSSLEVINIHYPVYQLHHQAFASIRSPRWEYSGEVEHQSLTYASFKSKE